MEYRRIINREAACCKNADLRPMFIPQTVYLEDINKKCIDVILPNIPGVKCVNCNRKFYGAFAYDLLMLNSTDFALPKWLKDNDTITWDEYLIILSK